ncbi:MAG: ATP-binding cassette domain-containing protein, partial [Calditrichaeota bacterium]|nr:ATP-binding cassette domain-containing protein [Calditrichota bacterium]
MIEVRNLSKDFVVHRKQPGLLGSIRSLFVRDRVVKHAVRDVSFSIGEGEIVGLVGANGAGKTTLVKMLSGIIHPTAGSMSVLGHDPWKRDNEFRRRIALIMGQKAQLWWDLPAADCFLLLREIYQIPEAQYRETLDWLCDALRVKGEINFQIRRLSLGERMKMELIASLLHRPRILFLDEPTIGLDVVSQKKVREFLRHHNATRGTTILLTSHYMADIEELCDRVIIVDRGSIFFDGRLAEVIDRFADHKIITIHGEGTGRCPREHLERYGEVIGQADGEVRLRVKRHRVIPVCKAL